MKSKKQKIQETFQLLDSARKQPLTAIERDYLQRHNYHTGQTILPIHDTEPSDEAIIAGIKDKLADLTLLIYESAETQK